MFLTIKMISCHSEGVFDLSRFKKRLEIDPRTHIDSQSALTICSFQLSYNSKQLSLKHRDYIWPTLRYHPFLKRNAFFRNIPMNVFKRFYDLPSRDVPFWEPFYHKKWPPNNYWWRENQWRLMLKLLRFNKSSYHNFAS